MFVSQASIDAGTIKSYGLKKRIAAVKNCRKISKSDMKFNDQMPKMKVDPESYVSTSYIHILPPISHILIRWQTVEADGVLCEAEPAHELPLTQDYFVY